MSLLNALVSADEGSRGRFISGMQGMRQDSKQEEAGRLANEFMNKHEFTPEAFKEFVVKNNIDMPTVQAIAGHIQKIKQIGPQWGEMQTGPGGQTYQKSVDGKINPLWSKAKQKERVIETWLGGIEQPKIYVPEAEYEAKIKELGDTPNISFSKFTPVELTKGKETKIARSRGQYELFKKSGYKDGTDTSKTPAEIANDAEKEILTLEEKVLDIRQRMASGAPTFNMGEGENAPPALLQFGTKGPIPTAEGERYIGLINNRISRLRQKMPKPAEPTTNPNPTILTGKAAGAEANRIFNIYQKNPGAVNLDQLFAQFKKSGQSEVALALIDMIDASRATKQPAPVQQATPQTNAQPPSQPIEQFIAANPEAARKSPIVEAIENLPKNQESADRRKQQAQKAFGGRSPSTVRLNPNMEIAFQKLSKDAVKSNNKAITRKELSDIVAKYGEKVLVGVETINDLLNNIKQAE